MKKIKLSFLVVIVVIISSLQSFAQGDSGNQPSGNLIYGSDGYIYGVYTKTTSAGTRPSTIYRYLPGATTIDPVYRFSDAVVTIQDVSSDGIIYGISIKYSGEEPSVSSVFGIGTDGTNYFVANTHNVADKGTHTIVSIAYDEFLACIRTGGGGNKYPHGVLFSSNRWYPGNYFDVNNKYKNENDRPTSILPFSYIHRWPLYDGSWTSQDIHGIWTATNFGGAFGKGSVQANGYFYEEYVPQVSFTGQGGGAMDGEGPVDIVSEDDSTVYAVTHRGGANNEGAIFLISRWEGNQKLYDFAALNGRPFGKPFVDFVDGKIWGLGRNFDTNTGFIYSYNPQTDAFNNAASFDASSAVNDVTSIVAHNGVIYGTARVTGEDSENGSLFAINQDGTSTQVIFKFVDGYSRLIEPNYTRTEVSVTPSLQADNRMNASSYRIEISENSDFSGTVHVVNSTDGLGKINPPGLKYSTKYYARVKTDIIDEYGTVTTFTTHAPEKYSFVGNPLNGATNVPLNGVKATANIVYGATLYTIEFNTSADFTGTSIVKTSAVPNQRTIIFDGLQPSTTYYTRAKTNYPSDWGPVRSFTTVGAAPPPEFIAETNEVKVYPNPFEHNFTIEPEDSGELNVSLIDLTGRELEKTQVTQQPVTLGNQLAPGIYLLRINTNGRTSVKRMVKK